MMRLFIAILLVLVSAENAKTPTNNILKDFWTNSFNRTLLFENTIEALDGINSLYHLFVSPDSILRQKELRKRKGSFNTVVSNENDDATMDIQTRKEKLVQFRSASSSYYSSSSSSSLSSQLTSSETITTQSVQEHVRRLLTSISSPLIANCSGVGKQIKRQKSSIIPFQPSPSPSFTYTCNNVRVSRLTHDAILASKDINSGVPILKAATLAAALSNEGSNITRNGVLFGNEPLPSIIRLTERLNPQQQELVSRDANVDDVSEIVTIGQLLSDLLIEDPLNLAGVLASLSPADNAALLINTTCTNTPSIPSTNGNDEEIICVCPHDFFGKNCEFGMAYSCGVVIADPLYNICIGVNGIGFEIPKQQNVQRQVEVEVASISSRIQNKTAWLTTVAPQLMGLTETTTGPSSFIEAKLAPKPGTDGFDDIEYGTAIKGYRPLVPGHPPCLFINREKFKQENSNIVSQSISKLAMRVKCSWQLENVTTRMSSGKTLVDEYGEPFASKLATINSTRFRAREFVESTLREASLSAPTIPRFTLLTREDMNYNPPGIMRCNGSALTISYINARVRNRTASILRGKGAPFFGLNCAEEGFVYAVGGVNTLATLEVDERSREGVFVSPFSLSSTLLNGGTKEGSLAIRYSPFSPTFVPDTSLTTLTRIDISALDGSKDILMTLSSSSSTSSTSTIKEEESKDIWINKDEFWAGGRFYAEVSVAYSPLGIISEQVSDLIQNNALITNATIDLVQNIRKFLIPESLHKYSKQPRLVLSNSLPLMIDDSSYIEPIGETEFTRAVRLILSIGLPLFILFGIPLYLWKRRLQKLDEKEEQTVESSLIKED